ncbi:outer membrane lipoprotein chaperone LolA [Mailhella sp.]|uniref:outer membrane lipoprotein chaperone LolA n=1 Tax=Mailhella sp. TaxID=1981029 RepID=UPI004064112B
MLHALRLALCLFLLLGTASAVHAAQIDAAAVAAKVQAVYADMQSFRSTFSQTLLQRDSGVEQKRSGTLVFQKPLRVRWETVAPHAELLMVTDKEIWNYLPDEELAYRYSRQMAEDSRSLIQVVTGQSALDRDFDVEAVQDKADGGLIHLMLFPKEPTTALTEAQIWIDPATSLIRRAMVMDFYGNTNTVELGDLQKNAAVSASDFTFVPPRGTEVEDHTEAAHPVERALKN